MALLKTEQVVERWHLLLENAQGNAEKVFQDIETRLAGTKVPDIKVQKSNFAPGFFRGLFGGGRDFLVVTETENFRLRPFQIFINARDYGNNLDVSWYMTYRLSWWQRIRVFLRAIPLIGLIFATGGMMTPGRGPLDLDLFDEQDLVAYATNAHACVKEATSSLMKALGRDPEKVDWKSRGFLGIS